jgi:hypothetical protein
MVTLFKRAKRWEKSQMSTTGEWINKMWYVFMIENYLALKWNKILIHAAI